MEEGTPPAPEGAEAVTPAPTRSLTRSKSVEMETGDTVETQEDPVVVTEGGEAVASTEVNVEEPTDEDRDRDQSREAGFSDSSPRASDDEAMKQPLLKPELKSRKVSLNKAGLISPARDDGYTLANAPTEEVVEKKPFWEQLWFKRISLVLHIGFVAYLDIGLDMTNAYQLYKQGFYNWSKLMFILLVLPNFLTWNFLHANGVSRMLDLPIAIFQLGPLMGIKNSFATGEHSADLVWYAASEGLIESPLTATLTAYIMTFGKGKKASFKISMLMGFVAIANKAVMVNFYGKRVSFWEKANDFVERFFGVALRISTLACFGYLMKESGEMSIQEDMSTNSQTALVSWIALSFASNVAMVRMAEPKCPISVSSFFGIVFIFTPPPAFISVFAKMKKPFVWYRRIEILCMITIAVNPMKPNPRIWDLLDQAPFLVQVFFVSLTGVIVHLVATTLYGMIVSIKEQVDASGLMKQITQEEPEEPQGGEVEGDEADPSKVGLPSSPSKELDKEEEEEDVADADDEQLDLQQRTAAIQYQLRQIVKNKDILMTNLFVHLQGASLHDPKIVLAVLKHWTTDRDKENIKMLEAQGMPERGRYKEVGLTVEQLAGDLHWTPAMLKEAGFKSADLKEGDNFCAFELKGAYTDAELALGGFSVNDLSEIGIDAEKLKAELTADRLKAIGYTLSDLYAAGFKVEDLKSQYTADQIKEQGYSAGEMRDGGFIAAELTKVDFTAKELKEGGFSAYELYEAGVEAEDMNKAEFRASELKGAGYTISALRRGGYGLDELKEIPVPPADLRAAGYTAGEFKAASYSVEQTKGCGFSLPDMREGGFDPKELKENGYTVTDFKHAGFTAKDLKDAEQNRGRDFPVIELKEAGYTPKEMMEGGYQRLEMKRAGYRLIDIKEFFDVTVETAKESGFTAKEMYVANFDASEMLRNGADGKPNFFETELMAAGYGEEELAPARKVYEFTLGQEVDARNPPSKWGPGVVTSVRPLKVKKGGYFFSREYKHVRPRNPPDAKL